METRPDAAMVILAVWSLKKGEAAKKSIKETTKRTGIMEVWQMDLSSYESVKQFVKRVEGLNRLDAIVENAGMSVRMYGVFKDNQSIITTNVVSTYLPALMILPKTRETVTNSNTPPHLMIVSSEVHSFTSFSEKSSANIFQTLNGKETANMGDRYNVSKLLKVFYTRELEARTKANTNPDATINFLNPGLCHPELTREHGWMVSLMKLALARTTEHGSRTLVQAVQAGPESRGEYMSNCRVSETAPLVRSEAGAQAQKRVWEELSAKLEKIQPGIMQNV